MSHTLITMIGVVVQDSNKQTCLSSSAIGQVSFPFSVSSHDLFSNRSQQHVLLLTSRKYDTCRYLKITLNVQCLTLIKPKAQNLKKSGSENFLGAKPNFC